MVAEDQSSEKSLLIANDHTPAGMAHQFACRHQRFGVPVNGHKRHCMTRQSARTPIQKKGRSILVFTPQVIEGQIQSKLNESNESNRLLAVINRRGWDSNPRYGFPYARFRGEYFQPLSHLSAAVAISILARDAASGNAALPLTCYGALELGEPTSAGRRKKFAGSRHSPRQVLQMQLPPHD